jgi:hypothetical protein
MQSSRYIQINSNDGMLDDLSFSKAFSSARTEYTSLRLEDRLLALSQESSAHFRRADTAWARFMLTSGGESSIRSLAEIIDRDQVQSLA